MSTVRVRVRVVYCVRLVYGTVGSVRMGLGCATGLMREVRRECTGVRRMQDVQP